jgi:hypothetical protein
MGKRMAKKPKGHKVDLMLAEKIDQIIHEIETAQSEKVAPDKVLKKASTYLKKEPSLTIPFVEALTRIPNTETAELLTDMMDEASDKRVVKSIKRTLYKLRQRGVRWEEKPPKDEPILKAPKPAEPQGYVGAIDSTGSRIIVITRSQALRGLLVVFSIVNDLKGIQEFNLKEFSKKGFEEFVKSSLSSVEFPIVTAPGAYCIHLLREACSLSQRLSKPLPQGYHDAENEFKDITWDEPAPLIYQHIKEDEVGDRPHLLKDSANLHKIMPFSTWHLGSQEVEKYASRIIEAQKSRIVLRADQKEARLNNIYRDALEELFPEDRRLLWKRRLEEAAYILLKTGREDEAKAALSAAVDLNNPFSPIDPNPFIWNLMLKSIQGMIESDSKKKEEEKKTSLIVTP